LIRAISTHSILAKRKKTKIFVPYDKKEKTNS
jgi:hypothetical protein